MCRAHTTNIYGIRLNRIDLSPVNPQIAEGSFLLGSHICPTQVLSPSRQNPQYSGFWNTHRPSNLCFKKSNNAFCIISVTCNWASNTLRYNKNITHYDKTTLLLFRTFENRGFRFGKSSMWGHPMSLFWALIQWQLKSQTGCFGNNALHLKWLQSHSPSDTVPPSWVNCS